MNVICSAPGLSSLVSQILIVSELKPSQEGKFSVGIFIEGFSLLGIDMNGSSKS